MSSGYGANYADVIEQDKLIELCPQEFAALVAALRKDEMLGYGPDIPGADGLVRRMTISSTRSPAYTSGPGMSRPSVAGTFWSVDGMYQLTPAGERCFFVSYG